MDTDDEAYARARRARRTLPAAEANVAAGRVPFEWRDTDVVHRDSMTSRPSRDLLDALAATAPPIGAPQPEGEPRVARFRFDPAGVQWRVRYPDGQVLDVWNVPLAARPIGWAAVPVPRCGDQSWRHAPRGTRCEMLAGHEGDHRAKELVWATHGAARSTADSSVCRDTVTGFKGAPCELPAGHSGRWHVSRKGKIAWHTGRHARNPDHQLCGAECPSAPGVVCLLRAGHGGSHENRIEIGDRSPFGDDPAVWPR